MREDWLGYRDLLSYNAAGRALRKVRRLLLYGACVRDEYPEIYAEYSTGRVPLAVCLEREHFNMVSLKLASIVARVRLEEVVVLTVDGSPHCVQLHHAVEEVAKVVASMPPVKHLVIEEGKVIEVSPKAVKVARYLSRVEKMLKRYTA